MAFYIEEGYRKNTLDVKSALHRFDYWSDIVCDEFVQLDCSGENAQSFNGELRGGIGVDKLRFAEVIADPQTVKRSKCQISKATETEFLISFQLSNKAAIRQNGREAILTPGSFALYDSTEPYQLTFNENFHQFIVQMPKQVLARHLSCPEQYTAIKMSATTGLGAVLMQFVLSLAKESSALPAQASLLSENLTNMIAMALSSSVMLEQVGNNSLVKDSLLNRILHYIDINLQDSNLNNQLIAQSQGISLRYLNKLFAEQGKSVHAEVLEKRLISAHNKLVAPEYRGHSIETIAYSVGFSGAGHFSRCFKKRFGLSPNQVR